MAINISKGCAPFAFKCSHDKDAKVFYSMTYRPKTWQANKKYTKGIDIVAPIVANGMGFVIDSGGISGAIEPTWIVEEGKKTIDNTVVYKAQEYDYLLEIGDTITASSWSGETGVVFDSESITVDIQTKGRLIAVPSGAKKITITNHITVLRTNGDIEEFDRSILLKINEQ